MKNVLRVISIISFAVAFILATVCGVGVTATYGFMEAYKGSTSSVLFGASSISFTSADGSQNFGYAISAKPLGFQIFGLCLALVALIIGFILEEKEDSKKFTHFFLSVLIFLGGFAMFFTKAAAQSQVEGIQDAIGLSAYKVKVSAPGFVISGILLIITAVTKFWSSMVDEY